MMGEIVVWVSLVMGEIVALVSVKVSVKLWCWERLCTGEH